MLSVGAAGRFGVNAPCQSPDGRSTLGGRHILWVVAGVLLVVMVPLVFRVPEHKGSW